MRKQKLARLCELHITCVLQSNRFTLNSKVLLVYVVFPFNAFVIKKEKLPL